MSPIVDVTFFTCLEEVESSDYGIWSCEALLLDGTVLNGTIAGDGRGAWDDNSFEPYADDGQNGFDMFV